MVKKSPTATISPTKNSPPILPIPSQSVGLGTSVSRRERERDKLNCFSLEDVALLDAIDKAYALVQKEMSLEKAEKVEKGQKDIPVPVPPTTKRVGGGGGGGGSGRKRGGRKIAVPGGDKKTGTTGTATAFTTGGTVQGSSPSQSNTGIPNDAYIDKLYETYVTGHSSSRGGKRSNKRQGPAEE